MMNSTSQKNVINQLKRSLRITWSDEHTEKRLQEIVEDAEIIINHKLGAEIDYSAPENAIARVVFLNYCIYAWNDCTEDFDEAYRSAILLARDLYEVKRYEARKDTEIK